MRAPDGHPMLRTMDAAAPPSLLPHRFADWFASRGWTVRDHQLGMVAAAARGEHALLIAPTGGGKTLAGFLPSLIELSASGHPATSPPASTRSTSRR